MGEPSSNRRFSLSSKGLQRIEKNNYENDFAFIIGGDEYVCPAVIADSLSPRVSSLRMADGSIMEFRLEKEDPDHLFSRILSIGYGHEVEFRKDEVRFVRSICRELLNSELFALTFEGTESEVGSEGLVSRLELLSNVEEASSEDVKMMASNFHRFSATDLDEMSVEVLEVILSLENLVLKDEDSLLEIISRLASRDSSYFTLLEFVGFELLSDHCMKVAFEFISSSFDFVTIGIWGSLGRRLLLPVKSPRPPHRFVLPSLDSQIILDFPSIFSMFRSREFRLLYRGTRDGFESGDFHHYCNGHTNTITIVKSTNDYVFGGYTPIAWTSRNSYVADPTLQSFLFTLTNPHKLAGRIFALEKPDYAIHDYINTGPRFGSHHDLSITSQCNCHTSSYSNLGGTYRNDTGLAGNTVLTGGYNFTVKEMEVFEVVECNRTTSE
jgi:hypothetical protein